MVIVLMGVTGGGKTTARLALAAELHWKFVDADSYHSVGNVAKMHAGIALSDADREPTPITPSQGVILSVVSRRSREGSRRTAIVPIEASRR